MGDLSAESVLNWIAAHPGWTGLLVFLVSFAESLAFVGVIVPGAMMMIAFGAAISTGYMEFWPTMWWAVAGAIAGDVLSYWLGYHYKDQLRGIWPLSKRPELLEHGIRFFERHGGKSVFLGRFVGPLRAVIPAVAGMLDMPFARFTVANVISALAWAPMYLLPGIVLGVSLELASEVAGRLALLLIVLLVGIYLLDRIVRFAYRRTLPYVDQLMVRLMGWTERHPLMGKLPAAVVDPLHAETRGLSLLAILLVATSIVFAVIVRSLWTHDGPGPLSQLVNNCLDQGQIILIPGLVIVTGGIKLQSANRFVTQGYRNNQRLPPQIIIIRNDQRTFLGHSFLPGPDQGLLFGFIQRSRLGLDV